MTEKRNEFEYDEWCTPESLIPPPGLREKWLTLAHFPADKDPSAPLRELGLDEVDPTVREDVEKDVGRAMWWWSTSEDDAHKKQRSLARVLLHALKAGNGKWFYFQGMHDFVSILILALGETGAEHVLRFLIETQLGHWVDKGIAPVVDISGSVFPLVRLIDPELFEMIHNSGVLPLFCVGWILTWFTHDVEDPYAAFMLVDSLLTCQPHEAERRVVFLCAALIVLVREDVLSRQCDKSSLHFFFTSEMPPIIHHPSPLTAAGNPRGATTPRADAHKPVVEINELLTLARNYQDRISWDQVQRSREQYGVSPMGDMSPSEIPKAVTPHRSKISRANMPLVVCVCLAIIGITAFTIFALSRQGNNTLSRPDKH